VVVLECDDEVIARRYPSTGTTVTKLDHPKSSLKYGR
jgi:hypothetical protein